MHQGGKTQASRLVNDILRPATLKGRTLQATLLQMGRAGVQGPLRLLSNLILVQFLMPEAFGLIAVVLLIHTGLSLLSDIGLRESVIREPDGENARFLQIVWTIKLIRSVFLTLAVFLMGIALTLMRETIDGGSIYSHPALPGIVMVSAPIFLLRGLSSANLILAHRRLRYWQNLKLEFAAYTLSIIVTIPLAIAIGTVWALLAGMIAHALFSSIMSHIWIDGPRMRIVIDRSEMKRLWIFGRWVIASSLFTYLGHNSDKIVFSILLSEIVFSIYSIAFNWVVVFKNILGSIINNVCHPLMSTIIQSGRTDIKRKIRTIFYIILIFSVTLNFSAPFIINLIIDNIYPESYKGITSYTFLISLVVLSMPSSCYHTIILQTGDTKFIGLTNAIIGISTIPVTWTLAKTFGIQTAIIGYAGMLFFCGQIYFWHRAVRNLVGWTANGIFLSLSILHFLSYFFWYVKI